MFAWCVWNMSYRMMSCMMANPNKDCSCKDRYGVGRGHGASLETVSRSQCTEDSGAKHSNSRHCVLEYKTEWSGASLETESQKKERQQRELREYKRIWSIFTFTRVLRLCTYLKNQKLLWGTNRTVWETNGWEIEQKREQLAQLVEDKQRRKRRQRGQTEEYWKYRKEHNMSHYNAHHNRSPSNIL